MTAEQVSLRDVVALLYRADWTRLSLSATLTSWTDYEIRRRMRGVHPPVSPDGAEHELPVTEHRRHVLVGPGGKYRVSEAGQAGRLCEVCDGETSWVIQADPSWAPGEARAIQWPPGRSLAGVLDPLTPAPLLSRYILELAGTAESDGRPAYQVVARPRPLLARRPDTEPGQLHVLVDAELGLLLRREELFHGCPTERTELTDLQFDPPEATDPAQFRPPPGMPVQEREPLLHNVALTGLAGDAVRTAAGLAGKAMGFTVLHWPASSTSEMPRSAVITPASRLRPAGDDLVNLLHRTGRPAQAYTAEVHEWVDGALFSELVSVVREALLSPALDGVLGPDAVWDAVAERGRVAHRAVWLQLAEPRRYRIDTLIDGRADALDTVGCDGERTWQARGGRVRTQRAQPLRHELACLADPAWLLAAATLTEAGPAEVAGRPGRLVVADRLAETGQLDLSLGWLGSPAGRVEAVLDTDLGVLLRVTCFAGERPVLCYEVRGLTQGVLDSHVFDVPPGAQPGLPLPGLASPAAAAKAAAGLGVAGTAALVGWLQKRPRSRS